MEQKEDSLLSGVKEIARRAKVSRATVDRVIHNRPGVSKKTKDRITAIIEELNYQPNVLAQRLALASRGVVRLAVLLPGASDETEYWKAPLEGISRAETEIKQYGVQVDYYFFDQNDKSVFNRQVQLIIDNGADGVLITPTFEPESIVLLAHCKQHKIPCVLMNSDIADQHRLCYIGPELFDSGYLSAQLVDFCLKEQQKVLVINIAKEIENNAAIIRKEQGFLSYFEKKRSSDLLIGFNSTDTDYESVAEKLTTVLDTEKNIGVIYVTNSRVSLVARWLESAGREDIILMGYDYLTTNIEFLKKGVIDFLICEKPQEQGYRSVMTLFQFLVFSTRVDQDYLMPIDIITSANYKFYRN